MKTYDELLKMLNEYKERARRLRSELKVKQRVLSLETVIFTEGDEKLLDAYEKAEDTIRYLLDDLDDAFLDLDKGIERICELRDEDEKIR